MNTDQSDGNEYIYSREAREVLLEEDELRNDEDGFMQGYEDGYADEFHDEIDDEWGET